MATEQEVAAAQKEVAKLRAQLQGLRLGDNLQEASNEIALLALGSEAARLQAQIDVAKLASRKTTVASGAAGPLAAAKAELKESVAAMEAGRPTATKPKTGGSEN